MNYDTTASRLEARFEAIVVAVMKVLLVIEISVSALTLFWLLYSNLTARLRAISTVIDLQADVQRGFAGVLLVVLGLELFETLRIFSAQHRIRLELILIVAIIAVGRQVIVLDLQNASGQLLLGVAALVLALTSGYFLVQRSQSKSVDGADSKPPAG